MVLAFLIGLTACALFLIAAQAVGEALTPNLPQLPTTTYLSSRLETLAEWGRVQGIRTVVSKRLPRRTPGAALVLNPIVTTYHVTPTSAWDDTLTWLRTRVAAVVDWLWRPMERAYDPFAEWDMQEWWYETFYVQPHGRHRAEDLAKFVPLTEAPTPFDTPTVPVTRSAVIEYDFTDSSNRRIRTEAEWARIIAVNVRTKAVRDAHRARGAGLLRKELVSV